MKEYCYSGGKEMEDLFDFNLFQQSFVVDNIEYTMFNQWLVQINSGEYVEGITLKSKQADGNFLLLALDNKNHTIIPILISILGNILLGIKNIPFPDKLDGYKPLFETIPKTDWHVPKKCFLKLSDKISALVTSVAKSNPDIRIEIEMIEHFRIVPNMVFFSVFDGITTTVYFEIQNE